MGFLPKKRSFEILISFRGNPSCVGEVVTSTVVSIETFTTNMTGITGILEYGDNLEY
jgi:hypothetical protein